MKAMRNFFVSTGEEICYVETEAEARRMAEESIAFYRQLAADDDEWRDEVEEVAYGQILQRAVMSGHQWDYTLEPTGNCIRS